MHKVVKVVLNLACGVGIGALGYRLGYKKGVEETKEWAAGEINTILDCKAEALVSEKEAEMTPELLKKMEFGKADEVIITKDPLENQILPEQDEIVVEVKPNKVDISSEAPKRSRKKLPYMVTCTEFDENFNDMTRKELEMTQTGDLYVGCSDELYSAREWVSEKLIDRMLKDRENGVDKWFVINEPHMIAFEIDYRFEDYED